MAAVAQVQAGPQLQEEFVPVKSRVWVSIADASTATLQSVIGGGALTYFFTRWRGLDTQYAAIVWLLFGLWNAVNDPLFGYISDRTQSRLGRRLPYIRYGAPIYALAFIFCWLPLPGTQHHQALLFLQLLVGLFVFDTLYTAIASAVYVMPYEMALSNKARGSILVWKVIFTIFPTAIPLVVVPLLQPGPGEDATVYLLVLAIMGVLVGTLVFASTFFYREKHFQQAEQQPPLWSAIRECFKNKSFIVFEVVSFTVIYIQTSLMQGVLYYFDELKVPGLPIYLALAAGIVAGLIFWIKQRDVWGIKQSMRLVCLEFAIGCTLLLFLGREIIPSVIAFFFVGVGFSGCMYLIPLMNGDVIDMDEHRTGLRREGMYAGVNSLITKPAISLAQAVFLSVITAFGYDQELMKGAQSVNAQTGVLVGWVAVPAILLYACFVLLQFYPLAGEAWHQIKHGLAQIHQEKEKRYLETHGYKFTE
ncbi:Isoprimeverose transporter [Thermoflexales bacterium]|nr:Isoprimeverose transporter [Thermoflexales bacterium]